jgi:hypothetical protein
MASARRLSAAGSRPLDASSRSEAIERAVDVGLLESFVFPPQPNLIPHG